MTLADVHGHFVWYELSTTNIEAAKAFYREVLGWGALDMSMPGMPYAAFTLRELPVCGLLKLSEEAIKQGGSPHWIGYVAVRDVDRTVLDVERHGGVVRSSPTTVFNFSRFAIVADPDEATFAIVTRLQPGLDPQLEENSQGRIKWHELLAGDCDKASNFYASVFGWQTEKTHAGSRGTYWAFSANGRAFGGVTKKSSAVSRPSWVYYFDVDDVDEAAKRVRNGGGRVIEGPVQIPGGSWVLQCVDPQDALFALVGKRKHTAIVQIRRSAGADAGKSK
jgi:hypothetical protein